jgi:uncharacterized protein with gpF-like domain
MPSVKLRRKGEVVLRPVHPNVGIRIAYQKALHALIEDMNTSVTHWITASYRANEPVMAQDALPAAALREAMRKLAARWLHRFEEAAPKLAEYFATQASRRSDAALRSVLRRGGFSVPFKMTRGMRDVLAATIGANVALIKSIPEQYLGEVEGAVMRSVQTGRDLASLTDEIESHYGVTRRRAAFIALDQNNKATSALQEARRAELGIDEAIWQHSGGGKHPRPKHVAASGDRYKTGVGLPIGDKGQYVLPGTEINCRCVSRAVVKGFS